MSSLHCTILVLFCALFIQWKVFLSVHFQSQAQSIAPARTHFEQNFKAPRVTLCLLYIVPWYLTHAFTKKNCLWLSLCTFLDLDRITLSFDKKLNYYELKNGLNKQQYLTTIWRGVIFCPAFYNNLHIMKCD